MHIHSQTAIMVNTFAITVKTMQLISFDNKRFLETSLLQQVDSSRSKNQAPISLNTNDVTIKSCEQELITKKCIAMHTNYF